MLPKGTVLQRVCLGMLQVDEINDMFAEARDYIEDAKDDAETVGLPRCCTCCRGAMFPATSCVGPAGLMLV